jgi:hypothetical protein
MAMLTRVILLLAVCASSVLAQSGNRISLELGSVTVWLGMDKSVAKQQIEAAEMVFDSSASNGQVHAVDTQGKHLFTLLFENGKLVYADRNWLRDDGSNALPSVMDALASLVDQGATNCKIVHAPISTPDSKLNRVFIDCGERGILLTYGSGTFAGLTLTDNAVHERIGKYR